MGAQTFSHSTEAVVENVHPPFTLLNATVYFNGKCDECRPACAAICCRGYSFVSLTQDEARSGKYAYREASDACDCAGCKRMRELGVRFALRKHADGSCIYLDGTRKCSIYADRPRTCQNYSCVHVPFTLTPSS
jgi:Fe-S-cluster containining protein